LKEAKLFASFFFLSTETDTMDRIELKIIGLSYSQTQSGAYALILSEKNGDRRLPIIIGGFEAQAIAVELEKMTPSRPLTHDLFKTFSTAFKINIKEIMIHNLSEGVFFSKLICSKGEEIVEIDARTSDAIAIGVRFDAPIFTTEEILSSAGILLDETPEDDDIISEAIDEVKNDTIDSKSTEDLKSELNIAIENEDYELASKIRDEIQKREKDQ